MTIAALSFISKPPSSGLCWLKNCLALICHGSGIHSVTDSGSIPLFFYCYASTPTIDNLISSDVVQVNGTFSVTALAACGSMFIALVPSASVSPIAV